MNILFWIVYREFEEEQKQLKKQYLQAGMSETQIEEMYKFDRAQFNRNLAYERRCEYYIDEFRAIGDEFIDEDTIQSYLDKPYSEIDYSLASRYWWIETIDNERIVRHISNMSELEKEIITMHIIEGYTTIMISKKLNIEHRKVRYYIERFKEFCKKIYKS